MDVKIGAFVFLKDKYFHDFPDKGLMKGKDRPFYFVFDVKNGIYWVVPISSNIEKYEEIYDKVLQKTKRCDTLVFGKVNGENKVFLIERMCPITKDYIESVYRKDNIAVKIDSRLQKEVCSKAAKVLSISKYNVKIIFPDVFEIEKELLVRMTREGQGPPKTKAVAKKLQRNHPPELDF